MTAPLRVGMVLTTMGHGGVPEVVLQLMRHLSPHGFRPSLCVLKREESTAAVCAERLRRAQQLGIDVHFAAGSSRKLETVAAVAEWIERQRLSVLHTHSNRPNVVGRLAGALLRPTGLRIVAHYHNQYDDKWDRDPEMLALERQLARSTDAWIAVSRSVQQHVAEHMGIGPERIDVVPNGVDARVFADGDPAVGRALLGFDPARSATRPIVGLVGRVCEQKGQEDFVAAALELLARGTSASFAMIGHAEDPALAARLQERIDRAGCGDRIRFAGNQDDMASVYAALDVVAAPSRWEGFGMMLVEAMAAGRPIVAARAGAIPELLEDGVTARLVPPRDPGALAAALAALLADPAWRARLGAAGRAAHARFGWPAAVTQLAAVYRRVLGAGRPGAVSAS